MCSARDNVALPTLGFPIRASAGHWPFSASPRLIAAVHALRRLLVPRHPPCALTILTVIGEKSGRTLPARRNPQGFLLRQLPPGNCPIPVSLATVQFSRSEQRRARSPMPADLGPRAPASGPVSQNSTACVQSAGADYIGRNLPVTPRCFHRCAQISPVGLPARAIPQVRSTLLELIARGDRCPRRAP